jgi:hypothetical protein
LHHTCSTHNRGPPVIHVTQLDLQEQEQHDALKAFWKTYGNLITWVLIWHWAPMRPGMAGSTGNATRA